MSEVAARRLASMFQLMSQAIEAEKDHLTDLDGAIGDGDHGITMSLGFKAINAELSTVDLATTRPSDVMILAGNAFLNAVGASTGPLYATGFRRAGQALADRTVLDLAACSDMIAAICAGVRERGKAQRGDKTMLDVWIPAGDAAAQALAEGKTRDAFWKDVTAAADNGATATATMIATKGRAARLRERSLGHIDPGAASAVILIRAMSVIL